MSKGTSIIGFILSFIAGTILMWGIDRGTHSGATAKPEGVAGTDATRAVNSGAVKVELFVMSKCPYGVSAENAFKDVVDKFGADVDFHVDFIGNQTPDGNFNSLHGPTEVQGDLYQACAEKYSAKWFDTILCQNKGVQQIDSNWEACAQEAGISSEIISKVSGCAQGQEGKDLLAASFKKATEKNVRGSPTIYIGGQEYQGGRKTSDFMKGICQAYQGAKPAICNDIPEAPKVNVTLLGDKRCAECDTSRLEGMLHQRVGNPVITKVDYSDPAGKKLFDTIKPAKLPAVVFDGTLDADKDAAQQFGQSARAVGEFKVVAAGDWNPACADSGGCELAECKSTMACRPEVPNKLDVFVMSHCPFGVKGLDAMQEVVDNFKKNKVALDFQVHYIGSDDPGKGLSSMHGPDEVADDLREVCAIEHYGPGVTPADAKDAKDGKKDAKDAKDAKDPLKFMEFVWCRDKNIKDAANWESCAKDNGMDADVLKKCAEGDEGKNLLKTSFQFSSDSGMSASPTWLVNNKYKFSGIDAATILTNVCQHNSGLAGCDAKLSGPPPRPQGGAAAPAPGCGG